MAVINLGNNQLIGSIPTIQLNTSSLESIGFTLNNLTGHIPRNIFDYLPRLKGLYLSWNQLSGRFPIGVFNCQDLEALSISDNNLEGIAPEEIGNLTKLNILSIGYNNFEGKTKILLI